MIRRTQAAVALALAATSSLVCMYAALAIELPDGVPTRSNGLWTMERKGRITDGTTTFNIEKRWRICLDAKSGRALHEFEVREAQALVAPVKQKCDEPRFSLDGNKLSMKMRCAGHSSVEDKSGTTTVEQTTIFVSADETRAKTTTLRRDALGQSDATFTTVMKRAGACPAGQRPGAMTMTSWRVNGEETLKAMQVRNLYREIETFRQVIGSRLTSNPRAPD
jgi:hypothetical protein